MVCFALDLSSMNIPNMPTVRFSPAMLIMLHVMPRLLPVPDDRSVELPLDAYELQQFHGSAKGITNHVVDLYVGMKAATHACNKHHSKKHQNMLGGTNRYIPHPRVASQEGDDELRRQQALPTTQLLEQS